MKKFTMIFASCLLALYTSAQVEAYCRYTVNGSAEPNINIYGEKKISSKVNLTYLAIVEEKWSEALVGISYSPSNWISLGLGAGTEHNPAIVRFCGSVWMGKGKTSLLLLGERGIGIDNYWYKTVLSYKISKTITTGAIAWRYHGIGPIVKYTPKKSDLTFWFLPAYDTEVKAKRLIFGFAVKL